ncbi:MAG: zinc ribbon domain-containing protein [Clostridiales bacterium]|nr:zinc ribbon domain-containing protein [Clostridiales bacterium]
MGIFGGLASAATSAANKTKNLAETTKLNISINGKEGDIRDIYTKIGEALYLKSREGTEADFDAFFGKIDALKDEIAEIRLKILKIKNIVLCANCNAENNGESKFCASCGATITVPEPQAAEPQAEGAALCTACRSPLLPGAKFCGSCGNKND